MASKPIKLKKKIRAKIKTIYVMEGKLSVQLSEDKSIAYDSVNEIETLYFQYVYGIFTYTYVKGL